MFQDPRIIIYADGACHGNGKEQSSGGWGCVIAQNGEHVELCGGKVGTTNNQMELTAVIKALEYVNMTGDKIIVHSDSKYVVDCFEKEWHKGWERRGWKNSAGEPVKNQELWRELLNLVSLNDVTFKWVKGHVGIPLNERADYLANQGRLKALYENQERMKQNV